MRLLEINSGTKIIEIIEDTKTLELIDKEIKLIADGEENLRSKTKNLKINI